MTRRPTNWNATETVEGMVSRCNPGEDALAGVKMYGDLGDIDQALIPDWIEELREAERNVRRFRYQLESLRSGRKCPVCGEPLVGRVDRAYCSTACRVENHRGTSPRTIEQRKENAGRWRAEGPSTDQLADSSRTAAER